VVKAEATVYVDKTKMSMKCNDERDVTYKMICKRTAQRLD